MLLNRQFTESNANINITVLEHGLVERRNNLNDLNKDLENKRLAFENLNSTNFKLKKVQEEYRGK
jgi:hypothetical protein